MWHYSDKNNILFSVNSFPNSLALEHYPCIFIRNIIMRLNNLWPLERSVLGQYYKKLDFLPFIFSIRTLHYRNRKENFCRQPLPDPVGTLTFIILQMLRDQNLKTVIDVSVVLQFKKRLLLGKVLQKLTLRRLVLLIIVGRKFWSLVSPRTVTVNMKWVKRMKSISLAR